jgi:DNA transformation protein
VKKRFDDHGISAHIVDLLASWAVIEVRRMFSGVGLFSRQRMFGFIQSDVLYLKESFNEEGEPVPTSFEKEYFEYERLGKVARIKFYKAPLSALEDRSYLAELAEQSWQSANTRKVRARPKAAARSGSKPSGKSSSATTKVSAEPVGNSKAAAKSGSKQGGKSPSATTKVSAEPVGKPKASPKSGSKLSGKSSSSKAKVSDKPRGKPPASVLKNPYL